MLIFISTKGKPVLHSLLNEQSPPLLKNNSKLQTGRLSGKLISIPVNIKFTYKQLTALKECGNFTEIVGIIQPVIYGNIDF